MIEQLFLWCLGTMFAAFLYVYNLKLTAYMKYGKGAHRMSAVFAWLRMLIVTSLLIIAMLYLPIFHFILITVLFIATLWFSIWYVTARGSSNGGI